MKKSLLIFGALTALCLLSCSEQATETPVAPTSPQQSVTGSIDDDFHPMNVAIDVVHDQLQGYEAEVSVRVGENYGPDNWQVAGFDLTVAYDHTALALQGVEAGQFLDDCAWEYFTYRFPDCDECPPGLIQLIAVADINNGANHPDCLLTDDDRSKLALLRLLVSNDAALECQFVPIKFFWIDCIDNSFYTSAEDSLLIACSVWEWVNAYPYGSGYVLVDDTPILPGSSGAPDSCDASISFGIPARAVRFHHGGVQIICSEVIDDRGDINLNGVPYEIADAVLFQNYFTDGLDAFEYTEGSIAASDVNQDGTPLTVADLVHLIRVIAGYAPAGPPIDSVVVSYSFQDGILTLNHRLGAAYLVFEGDVPVRRIAPDAESHYGRRDGNTHVLLTVPLDDPSIDYFSGDLLETEGALLHAEFATYRGLPTIARSVPTYLELYQNYPNPFASSTTICFGTVERTEAKVEVFNALGGLMATLLDETVEPGRTCCVWSDSNAPAGLYFYRVIAGTSTETGQMLKR